MAKGETVQKDREVLLLIPMKLDKVTKGTKRFSAIDDQAICRQVYLRKDWAGETTVITVEIAKEN
uniref:Uncharacterized protein n=1 Tax=viral metagenome TaxID=1070528 RepID=A0A6M3LLT6_9ZZZZ